MKGCVEGRGNGNRKYNLIKIIKHNSHDISEKNVSKHQILVYWYLMADDFHIYFV